MVQIHFDIEEKINRQLRAYMAENNIRSKSEAIKQILREKFCVGIKQGLRNLIK